MRATPTGGGGLVDPRDEFTLLCERCGYVIEGLDETGPCPECGKPIAQSLPHIVRPGSPWQQQRSVRSLIATVAAMYTRPRETLSRVSIRSDSRGLGAYVSLLACCSLGAPPLWYVCRQFWIDALGRGWAGAGDAVNAAGMILAVGALTWVVLLFLTFIEELGIQGFGRVHKRRITNAVAATVCAHACVGWITGAVLFWIVAGTATPSLQSTAGVIVVLAALFVGLLHFEVLVWLGVRRCKYANREEPLQAARGAG